MQALARRKTREYKTIDEALARMREANPHLSVEQARHLTIHGVRRNEDGTYSWKFDNYTRATSPYLFNLTDATEIWRQITSRDACWCAGDESWATRMGEAIGRFEAFRSAESGYDSQDAGHWVHHDQLGEFLKVAHRISGHLSTRAEILMSSPPPELPPSPSRRFPADAPPHARGSQLEYFWLIVVAVGWWACLRRVGQSRLPRPDRILLVATSARSSGTRCWEFRAARAFVPADPDRSAERRRRAADIWTTFFPGDVLGYGFPDFLAMLHLGGARIRAAHGFSSRPRAPRSRWGLGSFGRAAKGRSPRSAPRSERQWRQTRCGCPADRSQSADRLSAPGAGIATTFNAPIGGLLFAQEIVLLGETRT